MSAFTSPSIPPLNVDQSFASYSPYSHPSSPSVYPFTCEDYPATILYAPRLRTIGLPDFDDEDDVSNVFSSDSVAILDKTFELALILHSQTHIAASDDFYRHQKQIGALQIDFGHQNPQVAQNKYANKRQAESPCRNVTPPSSPRKHCSTLRNVHPYYHTSVAPQPILSC